LKNVTLQADVDASNSSVLAVGLLARAQANGSAYVAVLTHTGKAEIWLVSGVTNSVTVLGSASTPGGVTAGTLKFIVNSTANLTPVLTLYLNGAQLVTVQNGTLPSAGGAGFFGWGPNGLVDNFTVSGAS